MINDLQDMGEAATFAVDVCIVGGGAAGIALALSLENSGLRVCLLESGGVEEDEAGQTLYKGESIGHEMATDLGRNRGLGGTTRDWAGRCTPFSPIDFAERPWIKATGWPIPLSSLDRFYVEAYSICGVRDRLEPDEKVLRDLGVQAAFAGADDLQMFLWRFSSRADLPRMHFGMAFKDDLRRSQNIRVLLHANLQRFETQDENRTVTVAVARSLAGTSVRVKARAFVLGAGGLENPRILLNAARAAPGGFGNAHGLVGRYFQQHLRATVATIDASPAARRRLQDTINFFPSRHGSRYEVGFVLPEHIQRDEELLNIKAVVLYEGTARSSWTSAKRLLDNLRARRVTSQTAQALATTMLNPREALEGLWRREMRGRPALFHEGQINVSVDLEQLPKPDSRVTLTDLVDVLGLRQIRVDWRINPLEVRTARRMAGAIRDGFERRQLGTVRINGWLTDSDWSRAPFAATHHHIGTTRMAHDPHDGVVDPDCLVFGMSNLYVAGSSVFPTGGHANPTLTIVALALRLAEHLRHGLLV